MNTLLPRGKMDRLCQATHSLCRVFSLLPLYFVVFLVPVINIPDRKPEGRKVLLCSWPQKAQFLVSWSQDGLEQSIMGVCG